MERKKKLLFIQKQEDLHHIPQAGTSFGEYLRSLRAVLHRHRVPNISFAYYWVGLSWANVVDTQQELLYLCEWWLGYAPISLSTCCSAAT